MTEFKEYTLNQICSRLSSGKGLPASQIHPQGQYAVYGGNGVRGYTDKQNFVGDCAIIGRQGAYCGNVRYYSGEAYMTEHAIVACANQQHNTRYLAVLLSTMNLGRLSGQSAQPGLSVKTLSMQKVKMPSLEVQNKVATLLSVLDSKIIENQLINNNLQQQAIALFDEQFPSITDGDMLIGDYIAPKRGRSLLSKDAVQGDVPVVAGGLEAATYHNVANTVAPVLTISASGANAGFVNLWYIPVWSSDSSFIDSAMTDNVYFWYVLLKKRQREIFDAQTGSAQPHIYPQHIASMRIPPLDMTVVAQYVEKVTPLFSLIGANMAENTRLAMLRDTLLPKLMSGEIDVSDVEI